MKNAVLKRFVFITLITLVVSTLVCLWLVGDYNLNQTKASMIDAVKLIDYSLDYNEDINEQINKINPLIVDSSSRITVIDKNGVVLGDTYKGINYEDNHLQRPEVLEALKNGRGIDVRMSDTTNDRMLYVAQVCSDNEHILRVSVPYNGKVYLALWMLPAVVLSSIFAFIVSVLFSRHFTNTVSKPLQQVTDEIRKIQDGDYTSPLKVYEYDEITEIASAAHNLAQKIKMTMEEIVEQIKERVGNMKVFLTFDIDFLDPAYAPGTGTPEVGGFTTAQALELVRGLKDLDIVGYDVVEVAPQYDSGNITAFAAANLMTEFMAHIAYKKKCKE